MDNNVMIIAIFCWSFGIFFGVIGLAIRTENYKEDIKDIKEKLDLLLKAGNKNKS